MTRGALTKEIAHVDVVSFDVFDTALLRCVDEPAAVFSLVERAYAEGRPERRFPFADERLRAERAARQVVKAASGRGDVTLEEIYAQLEVQGGCHRGELLRLELAIERLVCVANPFIHAIYEEAIDQGRRVAFVSDMYLPAPFIGELLDAASYTHRACLLVSNAQGGESKGSGALYARLVEQLDVRPGRVLHIGDNEHSDVEAARRAGLRAIWYERCGERANRMAWRHPDTDLGAAVYRGLVHGRLFADRQSSRSVWYSLGYEAAGPAWWHYAGCEQAIVSALGASPTVLVLAQLVRSSGDPRGEDLRAGLADFARDLERLRGPLPWLRLRASVAIAPLLRLQRTPSAEEYRALKALLPARAAAAVLW